MQNGHGCKEESKLELPGHLCHQARRPSLKVKQKDGDEREREMPDAAGVRVQYPKQIRSMPSSVSPYISLFFSLFFSQSVMSESLKNLPPEAPTEGTVSMYWGLIHARRLQGCLAIHVAIRLIQQKMDGNTQR